MIQLQKISYILYFFLVCMFVVFAFLSQQIEGELYFFIVYIFTFLLLPLWNYLFNMIRDMLGSYFPQHIGTIFGDIIIVVSGLVFFFTALLSSEILIVLGVFYAIWKKMDPRIFFIGALILFCYIALYLVFGQSNRAEYLSILAYYLLFAGVIVQIIQSFLYPSFSEKK